MDKLHRHHRKSIRLKRYDYRTDGMYFVTICTRKRERLFGEIRRGIMALNEWGCIAHQCWNAIPDHYPFITLDAFIVMPDHMHGLLRITDPCVCRGKACLAPTNATTPTFGKPPAQSLSSTIGSYKSAVTRTINRTRDASAASIWQRGFYDHIVRTAAEHDIIRTYIMDNPARWQMEDIPVITA